MIAGMVRRMFRKDKRKIIAKQMQLKVSFLAKNYLLIIGKMNSRRTTCNANASLEPRMVIRKDDASFCVKNVGKRQRVKAIKLVVKG
jgi:hypothetical protein